MKFELIFSEQSEYDARDAIYYYDQINPALGTRFLDELVDTYNKLSTNPQYCSFISSAKKSNKLRDVKLHSFPYVVVFEIVETAVYVIAVISTYRKPLSS